MNNPNKKMQIMKTTTNNKAYKLALKHYAVICAWCPWHGGENASHARNSKSWKRFRKTRWKIKQSA